MPRKHTLIRDIEFDDLLENFFISAVLAILAIRLFLHVTGYPQLGGNGLHIAHMLWGGLLMLVAVVLLLTYLSRPVKRFAAIAGGIGFGTFIDELGKFITSDNDYFFKPTIALIYVIFILLFLAFRAMKSLRGFTPAEYLANGMEIVGEAAAGRLHDGDKARALDYLARADGRNPVTQAMRELCRGLEASPAPGPGPLTRIGARISAYYFRLTGMRWFVGAINAFFLFEAAASFALLASLLVLFRQGRITGSVPDSLRALGVADIVSLVASAASGILIIAGALCIRRSRVRAYEQFRRATLVSILVVQVFAFYHAQLQAFLGLLLNLLILTALNYMLERERVRAPADVAWDA
jgi:hypothetical protein